MSRKAYLKEHASFDYVVEEQKGPDFSDYAVKKDDKVLHYRVYGSQETGYRIYAK